MTDLKQQLIDTVLAFHGKGLSAGTSGNASVRAGSGFLITPTGVAYESLQADSLVTLDLDGQLIEGDLKPSSEWRFHRAIYASRPEVSAVVHVHSPYATGIACTRKGIPAFHYMIALAGGDCIRCAAYATFGTEELSGNALAALQDRKACLLANHGQIAVGGDLQQALELAEAVENLARQYWISTLFGEPELLDADEMRVNLEKFRHYGEQ